MLAAAAPAADWIDILPPANLAGWTRVPIPPTLPANPKLQWRVDTASKQLICTGDSNHEWLRWDKEVGDFVLQVEWRFTPKEGETKYNSGIGIRLSQYGELWFQAQTGLAGGWLFGQNFLDGRIQRVNLREQMKENRIKPAGEWNIYEIRAQGDKLTLSVNGAVVSEFSPVGLRRGYIGLEAEGFEIAFRNIRIQTLD
jgi:hypothetical protein